MAIGIDEIDEQDEELTSPEEEESSQEPESQPYQQTDIIDELLKDRGIEDRSKIKFESEDGEIEERSWDDLSSDEKRHILNQNPDTDPSTELDDDEIQMINQIRTLGLSPAEYIESLQKQGASLYAQQLQSPEQSNYETDDLTDDELFILDLQYRSPEMSEEEAFQVLDQAKQNDTLFNKQIEGLRKYYKELETDMQNQQQLELQEQRQQQFQQYSDSILDSIADMDSIGSLDLELDNDDKDELANFILGSDQAGINWFSKALEDTDTVVRMAWFALKGEDAFNEIQDYIAQQIQTASQNAYQKGYEEGLAKKPTVVIGKQGSQNNQVLDIDNLDF